MIRVCTFSRILVILTVFFGVVLSNAVAYADDVSSDTEKAKVTVMVTEACTMSGVGMNSHTATINPGSYNSHIGETTITAFCNDAMGFSIYAIGYTGDTDGNNTLTSTTIASPVTIATGTGTSGSSQWAMKLATDSGATYPITLQNSFGSFHTVPSSYTLVAKRENATDTGTSATGSSLTTTYQVYVASDQPADTYVGKVKYVLVHPYSNIPNQSRTCASNKICYWPNAGDMTTGGVGVENTMGDEAISSPTTTTSVVLWPSNFKRPGYGFAGWSSTYDYSNPDGFYGPQETIYFTAGQYTGTNKGLSLYAYWVQSAGTMQDWSGCDDLDEGEITALTDARDNDTYAVAKLADGNCWMIENLRLDSDASFNSTGVMAQGYGPGFQGLADSESANFNTNTTANSLYYIGTQAGTATVDIGSTGNPAYRMPRYNNRNTANTTANMAGVSANVYSYGNYYNFAASHADFTNHTGVNVDLTTSICPKGWRLPTNAALSSAGSDYWNLIVTHLGGGVNPLNMDSSAEPDYKKESQPELNDKIRQFPNNFVMAGYASGTGTNGRGSNAQYASSTSASSTATHNLFFNSGLTRPRTNSSNKYMGVSVRCLVQ